MAEAEGISERDADLIAAKLINHIREQKHDFWIDPEKHYRDHERMRGFDDEEIRTLHDLVTAYRNARGLFWKSFLGFAIVGAVVLAAFGVGMGLHR
nr:hypothetical protein 10 [Gammaproteobacteria bacterium]